MCKDRTHIGWFELLESRMLMSISDLDASFGSGGTAIPLGITPQYAPTGPGTGQFFFYAAPLPDGSFVATAESATDATATTPTDYLLPIADLTPDGQTQWTNTIGFTSATTPSSVFELRPGPFARLADGSLVIEVSRVYGNSATNFLDKFDPSGNLVTSFTTNYGEFPGGADAGGGILTLLPRSDGSLLSVYVNSGTRYTIQVIGSDGTQGATLVNGALIDSAKSLEGVDAVTLQSDGKMVLVGTTYDGTNDDLVVQRLNADGTADTSFGTGGLLTTSIHASPNSVAQDVNGNLIIAADNYTSAAGYASEIIRVTSAGALDAGFAVGGIYNAVKRLNIQDVKLASDGSIFAGVRRDQPYLLHLSANGSLAQAAVGTSLTTVADGAPYTGVGTTSDGRLLTFQSNGVIRRGIGFSQSQPAGDTTPPAVMLGRLRPVVTGSNSYFVSVSYSDAGSGVDAQTVVTGNVLMKYGRNHVIYGRLVGATDAGGGQINATYSFAAPGGSWTPDDAGTYTIQTASDEVTDNAGNGLAAKTLGHFTIRSAKRKITAATPAARLSPAIMPVGGTSDWLKSKPFKLES